MSGVLTQSEGEGPSGSRSVRGQVNREEERKGGERDVGGDTQHHDIVH